MYAVIQLVLQNEDLLPLTNQHSSSQIRFIAFAQHRSEMWTL